MPDKKSILKYLRQNRDYLRRSYHITRIGLFGSFVRNEQGEGSDIDILVEFSDGTSQLYELKNSLRTLLRNEFGLPVDLAREKYLKPYIKQQILAETLYVD